MAMSMLSQGILFYFNLFFIISDSGGIIENN